MKASSRREETRDRIIAAAGAVFAERGFRGTTVRQITARAGVNLAAVNYYFRDKSELYLCVLKEAKRHLHFISVEEIPGDAEERLRGFIDRFVHRLLDPQRPFWHARVLTQEMSNPSPALGVVVRELTGPLYRRVSSLIAEIVDRRASAAELDLLTLSIFGQSIFYVCSRPVVEQLALDLGRTSDRIERISRHIAAFSLAGMKDFRRRATKKSPAGLRARPRHHALS
jgi:AcrR family transcriptional regulator